MTSPSAMTTPLTEEQAHELRGCWEVWLTIRRENGYPDPPRAVDIYKGALLGRMTMEGKMPHPNPPPTFYSRPWWEVIEANGADLHNHDVSGPWPGEGGVLTMAIGGCAWLLVREERNPDYPFYPFFVITHPRASGEWILRHRHLTGDPPVRKGQSKTADGWVDTWMGVQDWRLIGPRSSSPEEGGVNPVAAAK